MAFSATKREKEEEEEKRVHFQTRGETRWTDGRTELGTNGVSEWGEI